MTDKAAQIAKLLAPTVTSLGVELLGVEYLTSQGGALLRLYIDVPADEAGGEGDEPRLVSIENCEAVSREVSAQLDVEDPITSNYTLEVSSPGIDRPLFTLAHFQRFLGESAKVTLRLPQNGRRRLQGRIAKIEDATITFVVDGVEFPAAFDNIEKARLVPDWAALGLAPTKPGKGGAVKKDKSGNTAPGAEPDVADEEESARAVSAGDTNNEYSTEKSTTHMPAADKPTQAE